MRVTIINQYYAPDVAPTGQLAADLAEDLVHRGHAVTVITSDRYYVGAGRLPTIERRRGVRIVRVPATAFGRKARLLRAIDYATYFAGSCLLALLEPKPEVVLALSTPPFIAAVGALARRLRGVKLVFWVMDVYPDIAIELGAIASNGAVASVLRRAATHLLKEADAIIALDEAMRQRLIAAGAEPTRVNVIDNWCDGELIRPAPRETNSLRRQLGLGDTFTVAYSGNMGLGHDFATLLDAMALLRSDPIHWLFVGDGPRLTTLKTAVGQMGMPAVTFLGYRPKSELAESLAAADASIVTIDRRVGGLLVPSKLYGIMAAGIPVIYVGPPVGRPASVVRDAAIGISVRNGDASGLAEGIRHLLRDRDRCRAMGKRAREVFLERFDRRVALEKHHQLLLKVDRGRATHGCSDQMSPSVSV